ncbi:hypothetical protein OIU79_027488, partial [Salix purpurea]
MQALPANTGIRVVVIVCPLSHPHFHSSSAGK